MVGEIKRELKKTVSSSLVRSARFNEGFVIYKNLNPLTLEFCFCFFQKKQLLFSNPA
jgi:hypothetical protein